MEGVSRRPQMPTVGAAMVFAALAVGSLATGLVLVRPRGFHLGLAGAAVSLIAGLATRVDARKLLFGLILWLPLLGFTRRLVAELAPPGHLDPLLAVGPLAVLLLLDAASRAGAFRQLSVLAKAVFVLSLLIAAASVNPLQGTLLGGFFGLLFLLVPLLGFWIGRGLCDDRTFGRVLVVIALFAPAAAAYGLVQTFSGFPTWDNAWITNSGYAALSVGGVTRAFSTFSSAAEYATFLAIAVVIYAARGRGVSLAIVTVPMMVLVGTAVFFDSSRGIIVLLVATLALLLGTRMRVRFTATAAIVVICLFLLPKAAARLVPAPSSTGTSAALVGHQASGLAAPFNDKKSTLRTHLTLIETGLRSALTQPLGIGTGAATIAGRKFGGLTAGTEADPSNAAVAAGFAGLVAYLAVAVIGFHRAYRLAYRRRDALSFAALGILCVSLFQWLNGGDYSVAFVVWLTLGWIDRAWIQLERGS
jgi:hypothetical protein